MLLKTIIWSILTLNLAMLIHSAFKPTSDIVMGTLLIAPIVEELLKFIASRSLGKPLYIGMGWQVGEMLYKGLDSVGAAVVSPHLMTTLIYKHFNCSWKSLPLGIGFHLMWNAFFIMSPPDDRIPMIGLIFVFGWLIITMLRKSEKKGGENNEQPYKEIA